MKNLTKNAIVTCTKANSSEFTTDKEYKVTSHKNIVSDNGKRYSVSELDSISSEFKVLVRVEARKSLNGLVGGDIIECTVSKTNRFTLGREYIVTPERTVTDNLGQDYSVKRLNGLKSTLVLKAKPVVTKKVKKTVTKKAVIKKAVKKVKKALTLTEMSIMELTVLSKFAKVAWTKGKNYYVVFKLDTGKYGVFSEDKLRRIDTIFLSKKDAFTAKKELNVLIKKTK